MQTEKYYRVHLMGHVTEVLCFLPGQTPDILVYTRAPALIGTRPALPESALFEGKQEAVVIYGWSAIFSIDSEALSHDQAVQEMLHKRTAKPFTGSPEQLAELDWSDVMKEAAARAVEVRAPADKHELWRDARNILAEVEPKEAMGVVDDEDVPF